MPVPKTVGRIERKFVKEQLYTTLRTWIVDGTLKPDEKVRDVDLAARFGVSRMPVREAFQRLEEDGLVQTAPNRWTRVSPLNLDDAMRIYPIVSTLEAFALRSAGPRASEIDLTKLTDANQQLARTLKTRNAAKATEADRDFHFALVRPAGNPELTAILDQLRVKLRRIEIAYFDRCALADRSVEEHLAIIRALQKGDIDAAVGAVATNWHNGLTRLLGAQTAPAKEQQG